MGNIINPVIQQWVMELNWKEQTGLISAIRGVDSSDIDREINSSCKKITKMIRFLVLNNAVSRTGFMTDRVIEIDKLVDILDTINDQVIQGIISLHWFDHILMAIKIIIDKHPNPYTRMYWHIVYTQYNSSPVSAVEKNALERATITDENVDELKTILSVVDGEKPIITDDRVSIPINDIGIVKGIEIPSSYLIQLERFVDGKDVTYNCINTNKKDESKFKDMLNVLPQLDAIITYNWNVIDDCMSADYKPDIHVSKGPKIFVEKAKPDTFMVDILSSNLLYMDKSGVLWVIIVVVKKDIIILTISEPNYSRLEWLRLDNKSVYSLIPHKMSNKEDKYIHGEIRVRD